VDAQLGYAQLPESFPQRERPGFVGQDSVKVLYQHNVAATLIHLSEEEPSSIGRNS
jgi:hypothetical protein